MRRIAGGVGCRARQGFALIVVLGLLLILSVLCMMLNRRSAMQQRLSSNRLVMAQQELSRKAAIEYALLKLRNEPGWRTTNALTTVVFAGYTNSVSVLNSAIAGYTNAIVISAAQTGGSRTNRVAVRMELASSVVLIADTGNHRIRKVDLNTGIITAFAGTGANGSTGDGGPALSATFLAPRSVYKAMGGAVVIADLSANAVRRVDPTNGYISTVTSPTTPSGVWEDDYGRVFYTEQSKRLMMIAGGTITTIAGSGSTGYSGDGGPATSASLNITGAFFIDRGGNVLLADSKNHRIRRVDARSGIIVTVAGNGTRGYSGDGGPATSAKLDTPMGVCADEVGNIYIADTGNHVIRRVSSATGLISTTAGLGVSGYFGDGLPSILCMLNSPESVAVGSNGTLYIADTDNHCIRVIDPVTGIIYRFAGHASENGGNSGDGGPATSAYLNTPSCVCVSGLAPKFSVVRELY